MFDKETKNEDLRAFEAALGALRPRSDRLDDRFRAALTKEACVTSPLPPGEGQGEGSAIDGIHRFVCLYCGSDAPVGRLGRRWAWPAAFSAMTAAAAVMLVLVVVRGEPHDDGQANLQAAAGLATTGPFDTSRPASGLPQRGDVLSEVAGSVAA